MSANSTGPLGGSPQYTPVPPLPDQPTVTNLLAYIDRLHRHYETQIHAILHHDGETRTSNLVEATMTSTDEHADPVIATRAFPHVFAVEDGGEDAGHLGPPIHYEIMGDRSGMYVVVHMVELEQWKDRDYCGAAVVRVDYYDNQVSVHLWDEAMGERGDIHYRVPNGAEWEDGYTTTGLQPQPDAAYAHNGGKIVLIRDVTQTQEEYEATICYRCGARTTIAGDGYDGLCADCADRAEAAGAWGSL